MSTAASARDSSFRSGGYFLAVPTTRSGTMNAELLPERILTASDCLVAIAPNTWTIAWTVDTSEKRREAAARFGLDEQGLGALTAWSTAAMDTERLGWPGVFFDVDTARDVRARFLPAEIDVVLFGIALPADLRDDFLEQTRPGPREGTPGVVAALQANTRPDERGTPLGFDVLCWDTGGFHSYVCNGLETDFQRELGVIPNLHGFYATEQEARRCAEYAGLETTGAEPGIWLPWRVARYAY